MSTQHEAAPVIADGGLPYRPVRRPVTLALAVWGAVTVAALAVLGAIVAIIAGRDSIRAYVDETVRDVLGEAASADLVNATIGAELDSAYRTLVIKAAVAIGAAVLVLIFALAARGAALPARIALTAALVIGMCGGSGLQLGEADALPALTVVTAALTPLLSIAVIVLLFLPPTNRYAAARKRRS
ncbi:MAG TPA: hypothetical protein VF755_05985 [Catenuloplanes sp.]|jgi:hypothetical protein